MGRFGQSRHLCVMERCLMPDCTFREPQCGQCGPFGQMTDSNQSLAASSVGNIDARLTSEILSRWLLPGPSAPCLSLFFGDSVVTFFWAEGKCQPLRCSPNMPKMGTGPGAFPRQGRGLRAALQAVTRYGPGCVPPHRFSLPDGANPPTNVLFGDSQDRGSSAGTQPSLPPHYCAIMRS